MTLKSRLAVIVAVGFVPIQATLWTLYVAGLGDFSIRDILVFSVLYPPLTWGLSAYVFAPTYYRSKAKIERFLIGPGRKKAEVGGERDSPRGQD